MNLAEWPAPHKTRGGAVNSVTAARMIGWKSDSAVSTQMHRTREGAPAGLVPFPEPAGYALRSGPHWTGLEIRFRRAVAYWWKADIVEYRTKLRRAPRRPSAPREGR